MTTSQQAYSDFFARLTGFQPYPWQARQGANSSAGPRILRIPTGMGKTAGVVIPWLYHRVFLGRQDWPTRLVYALPMRTLVEQIEAEIGQWIARLPEQVAAPPLHVFMGGRAKIRCYSELHKPAIFLGTQDMLLSRALNRGYGTSRGLWPVDFALTNQDALWVCDEVQLMDAGLTTSAQLAAFRDDDAPRALRPSATWWMSATLRPDWLGTVDGSRHLKRWREGEDRVAKTDRVDGVWDSRKHLQRVPDLDDPKAIADLIKSGHKDGQTTLVVMNTVAGALKVMDAVRKRFTIGKGKKARLPDNAPALHLVHSRFRGVERAQWGATFLNKNSPLPTSGRIIVATQVVEAGVDLSANTLITQLAPWSSLVQRFGRCARRAGESGKITVIGPVPDKEKAALPYDCATLAAADRGLKMLASFCDGGELNPRLDEQGAVTDASIGTLERFEDSLGESALERLYPRPLVQVLRRPDLDELFDTAPDLSGTDLDIGPFIRSGKQRDLRVFWRQIPKDNHQKDIPRRDVEAVHRDELCPCPIGDAKSLLKRQPPIAAWVEDYTLGIWRRLRGGDTIAPGMRIMLDAGAGGYATEAGLSPTSKLSVDVIAPLAEPDSALSRSSESLDDDSLSEAAWKTIATHGREAGEEVKTLIASLEIDDPDLEQLLDLAARWHDVGKSHATFAAAISDEARKQAAEAGILSSADRSDLAKAPDGAWRRPAYPQRPGFRHELASMLALLDTLRQAAPDHDALGGDLVQVWAALDDAPPNDDAPPSPSTASDQAQPAATSPHGQALAALSAKAFNLVAYLVTAHHGKVRLSLASTARDQASGKGAIFGVCEGDTLPPLTLAGPNGQTSRLGQTTLSLAPATIGLHRVWGPSWVERTSSLVKEHGLFRLAYLEALLRAADVRASIRTTKDPLR